MHVEAGDEDDPSGTASARRRLYSPGATDDDVERYRALLGEDAAPEASSPPAASPKRFPGFRVAVVAAAVVAAAAIPLGVGVVRSRPTPPPTASSAPVPAIASVSLTIAASTREAFVRNLERGADAGLADHFLRHPESRPPQLTTLTRAATEEHAGRGTGTVTLNPSMLADHGGRFTVVLTLAHGGDVGWRAVRPVRSGGSTPSGRAITGEDDGQLAGLPVSTTTAYTGAAPIRLEVAVDPHIRWDALVVFSD